MMIRKNRAFTLAELMMVVAMMSLLSSGSFLFYTKFRSRSRRILARRESFLAERALELHQHFEGRRAKKLKTLVDKGYLQFRSHGDEDRWLAATRCQHDHSGRIVALKHRLPDKEEKR